MLPECSGKNGHEPPSIRDGAPPAGQRSQTGNFLL